jgi:spore coat polysaccharide biosynthesis protein SpsF
MDRNIVAIIQARVASSRLPNKCLADIKGAPLLAHIIRRVRAAKRVSKVVVATTTDGKDQAILDLAKSEGVVGRCGSADDVLARYYETARAESSDVVVRITGDNPFVDPNIVDLIVDRLVSDPALDYVSNNLKATFPEGLDVESFTFRCLERVWREAELPSEREHVTPYIWKSPGLFRVANVECGQDASDLRLTVDYLEDLEFARAVYNLMDNETFGLEAIFCLLKEHPELRARNPRVQRHTGYLKSVAEESRQVGAFGRTDKTEQH